MADNTLAGGGVGVGVYEAAELGIVVAGLEVIELGVDSDILAALSFDDCKLKVNLIPIV